jgi:hypothetical protein
MSLNKCPLCNGLVRVVYRDDGNADHYESVPNRECHDIPNPIPPVLQSYLRAKRKGKRTLAIVGAAWTTGPWAPFDEEGVDIWGENEIHGLPWCKEEKVTFWFQMHPKFSFDKDHIRNHREWLRRDHPFNIYMQRQFDDIPKSVVYPLRDVQKTIHIEHGEETETKIFTSTFAYQLALALQMEIYDRIELFGIELTLYGEYGYQREAMAYWIGKADGMGKELWIPEQCSLFISPLYGYEEVRKGDSGEIIWSMDNA